MPNSNPASFIDEVPDYEARDGRIYITMGDHCLAMPVAVFLEGCVRGKAAIAQWQVDQLDRVVPLPRR